MTNLDAIRANISDAHGVVLTENHFMKALIDVGVVPTDLYSKSRPIDLATIKLYDVILGGSSITEGSLSYSVNKAEVRQLKADLEKKLGISEGLNNRIRGVRAW